MPILHPLDKLREWAASYGYTLIETTRMKRIEYKVDVEISVPPEHVERYIHSTARHAITEHIFDILSSSEKPLIKYKRAPHSPHAWSVSYEYEMDIIVPE